MWTNFRSVPLRLHATLPARFTSPRPSEWARSKRGRAELGCFLEGPACDRAGNLYVVDIPFGRIFRLTPAGGWEQVTEYDGWPNGLKIDGAGRLLVADHKRGLIRIDPASGERTVLLDQINGAPLLGLNDLTLAADGVIYTTDQGNTGLTDPRGRVLRLRADGAAEIILDNGPSPNGLVFNDKEQLLHVAMTRANAVWRAPLLDGRAHRVGVAIQLSGGVGPDGLAFDQHGALLVAHPQVGVWRFDHVGRPRELFEVGDALLTNVAVRADGNRAAMFVTDSGNGRIFAADI